jgi:hypothetical protein
MGGHTVALKPIMPQLRGLHHNSIQPAKVQIVIPAGDTLYVSAEVADQLIAENTHFEPAAVASEASAAVVDQAPVEADSAPKDKRSTKKA